MAERRTRLVLPTVVLLLSAVLAGCSLAASPKPALSPTSQEATLRVLVEYARCVRAHGVPDFPDPQLGPDGRAGYPYDAPRIPDSAIAQCRASADRLPDNVPDIYPPANIPQLIEFARCVRAHGLSDWPDPDANGNFRLPPDLQTTTKSGPVWERVRAAWDACRAFNPSGQLRVSNG